MFVIYTDMKKATLKWPKSLILLEARAGVEPTYTDLQSGA